MPRELGRWGRHPCTASPTVAAPACPTRARPRAGRWGPCGYRWLRGCRLLRRGLLLSGLPRGGLLRLLLWLLLWLLGGLLLLRLLSALLRLLLGRRLQHR